MAAGELMHFRDRRRSALTVFAAATGALLVQVSLAAPGEAADASARASSGSPPNYMVNAPASAPVAPYTDNFTSNFQMAPTIARDPVSGNFMAGSMDYIDEIPCAATGTATLGGQQYTTGRCGSAAWRHTGIAALYLSSDGAHWTQQTSNDGATSGGSCTAPIHTMPGYCPAGLVSGYDAEVAFGPKPSPGTAGFTWANGARAYYANLPLRLGTSYPGPVVAVSRSDDDGATWAAPVVLAGTASTSVVNDKEGLWVDANSASPCFGDAYAAWDQSTDGGFTWQAVFSRSSDGGSTWTPWLNLLPQATVIQPGPMIQSLPDGTVAVGLATAVNQVPTVQVALLSGCGQTAAPPVSVASFGNPPYTLVGSSFPATDFPAIASDGNGALYMTWADYTSQPLNVVRFSKSVDGGHTWTAPVTLSNTSHNAVFPVVAVTPNGAQVLVSYMSLSVHSKSPGAGAVSVQSVYVRSGNGGSTWILHPLSTSQVDLDGSSTPQLDSQQLGFYTSIIITTFGGHATAFPIWTDPRNAVPCPLVDKYRAAVAAGQSPSRPDPDIKSQCPLGFGNTDIYDAVIPLS